MYLPDPKINFNLQRTTSDKWIILLSITWNRTRYRRTFGLNVSNPADWDKNAQKFIAKNDKDKAYMNEQLAEAKSDIIHAFGDYRREQNRYPTENEVHTMCNTIFQYGAQRQGKRKLPIYEAPKAAKTFNELYDQYFEALPSTTAPLTRDNYKNTYKHILDFQEKYGAISFSSINKEMMFQIIKFLQKDKGLSEESVKKSIRHLKSVLLYCHSKQIIIPGLAEITLKNLDKSVIVASNTVKDKPALDSDFVSKLLFMEVPPVLEKTRDMFVLQCRTSLRVSDLRLLGKEHFNWNKKRIQIKNKKIKKAVTNIPITDEILFIYNKYDGNFPKLDVNLYNIRIKELCKLAGYEDWDLISSHTARRTFITICKSQGFTTKEIMQMTGHQTSIIVDGYYKPEEEKTLERHRTLSNAAFERFSHK